jgi:hypothetical protein
MRQRVYLSRDRKTGSTGTLRSIGAAPLLFRVLSQQLPRASVAESWLDLMQSASNAIGWTEQPYHGDALLPPIRLDDAPSTDQTCRRKSNLEPRH